MELDLDCLNKKDLIEKVSKDSELDQAEHNWYKISPKLFLMILKDEIS